MIDRRDAKNRRKNALRELSVCAVNSFMVAAGGEDKVAG
jgi:hypothetical protein